MRIAAEQARKTWTEADLQALPDDGYIHELGGFIRRVGLGINPYRGWF